MDAPLIVSEGLGFRYRQPVLRDFSLVVLPGTIVFLVGLNGAGKSTALSLLAGERVPGEGHVRILGGDPRRGAVRSHLFFLREEAAPPSHLSALEAIRFHLALYGRPSKAKRELLATLERFGLAAVATARVSTFSKGMARRLEFATLEAVDPEVWLLDEPQSGLDPNGLHLFRTICGEARSRGRAIVAASHHLGDVLALGDRIVVLEGGKTVFDGGQAALMDRVGARAFVVRGGTTATMDRIRQVVAEDGGTLEGPRIPVDGLEESFFGGRP